MENNETMKQDSNTEVLTPGGEQPGDVAAPGESQAPQVSTETGTPDTPGPKGFGKVIQWIRKKPLFAAIPAVVIVAAITGVLVYNNTPAQRLIKQINMGIKSLEELDYESAKASFANAIEIDDTDLEAYRGLMMAYAGLNDKDGMADTYETAVKLIRENMDDYSDENKDTALEILRYVQEIYGDDKEKELESTILAHELFPKNDEFVDILIDDYFILGGEHVDNKEFDKGIEYLENALELDPDNEQIKDRRDRAVKDYISYAFDTGDYDLVLKLVEKYKGIVDGIDDDFIQKEINEINRIKAEEAKNREYMKVVYDTMATEDYEAMLAMYNSEECQAFLQRMTRKVYYYFPDDNSAKSGTGAACYYYNGVYYFYYGNYENGNREGYGTTFIGDTEDLYRYFKGTWSGDKPNGSGEEISRAVFTNTNDEYNETITGELVGGLWNGHVDAKITAGGHVYDVSYDAVNGKPTKDRTAEFDAQYPGSRYKYPTIYIYAFDGYNTYWRWDYVWSNNTYGGKLGTIGF